MISDKEIFKYAKEHVLTYEEARYNLNIIAHLKKDEDNLYVHDSNRNNLEETHSNDLDKSNNNLDDIICNVHLAKKLHEQIIYILNNYGENIFITMNREWKFLSNTSKCVIANLLDSVLDDSNHKYISDYYFNYSKDIEEDSLGFEVTDKSEAVPVNISSFDITKYSGF